MKEYVGVGRLQLKVRIVYISRIVVDVPFSSMVLFTFFSWILDKGDRLQGPCTLEKPNRGQNQQLGSLVI